MEKKKNGFDKHDVDLDKLLNFLEEDANFDISQAVEAMRKRERQKIIEKHPYKITQAKDGRWHTFVRDDTKKDHRRHVAKTSIEDLYDLIVESSENQKDGLDGRTVTLETLYPKWLKYKEMHTQSKATVYRIDTEWKKHYKDTQIVKKPLKSITKINLDEWAHELIKSNDMSRKQYYNTSVIMRQMMQYALDRDIIEDDQFSKVHIDGARMFRRTPKPPSETQVFTSEEVLFLHNIAMNSFTSRRNYKHQLIPLAVMFFFQSGLRISEICALKYDDIEGSKLHVQRMYSDYEHEIKDKTKGFYEDRYVLLTDDAYEIIGMARKRQQEEHVSDSGYIFSMTPEPAPYSEIRKTFIKYCNRAEILPRTSHKSRKTVVSNLLDSGVNVNTVREMLGHLDERTTFNNYCFDTKEESERRKAINNSLCVLSKKKKKV